MSSGIVDDLAIPSKALGLVVSNPSRSTKDTDCNSAIRHLIVRYPPPQPPIRAFGQAPRETRAWAGNPGFSHNRFCLRTPGFQILRWKSAKVSDLSRENSRFAETGSITTTARSVQQVEPTSLRQRNLGRRTSRLEGSAHIRFQLGAILLIPANMILVSIWSRTTS